MACTDDEQCMAYLNQADSAIPRLDVTDDFISERQDIVRAQGAGFHFTFGDYIVKSMLGPIDPYFDSLDSGSFNRRAAANTGDGCCAIF